MNNESNKPNRRILVIDDNASIHADIRKILAPDNGEGDDLEKADAELFGETIAAPQNDLNFELVSAFQGQDGLAAVREAAESGRPFAMAFVDMRMPPGWDGIETATRLWEVDPNLQIVICTAYSDYSWDEMIAKLGASDRLVILKKPFDAIEVLQLASALTEKWRLLQHSRRHAKELEDTVQMRTRELLKSEERFRLIAENAAELIMIVDTRGTRIYSSPAYERLLGFSQEESRAIPAFEHVHPDDKEFVIAATRRAIEHGGRQLLEFQMQHKDGSWRTMESHSMPFRNAAAKTESALVIARDITERKQSQAQRQILECGCGRQTELNQDEMTPP